MIPSAALISHSTGLLSCDWIKISLFCHTLVHQDYERNLCKWPRMFNLKKDRNRNRLTILELFNTYCFHEKPIPYLIKPIYFQLIHTCVVDTSIVFPHRRGPPLKRALRNLTSELLQRIIQEDGMYYVLLNRYETAPNFIQLNQN